MCQINSVPMRYAIGYLDVLTPPIFEENNNNNNNNSGESGNNNSAGIVVVSEGSNASLSCQASGHPAPEIVWRREDNEPIRLSAEDEVPKVEGATLAFDRVGRPNSGAYLCIASNGVQPSASKRQVLDVQYRPVIRLPQTEVGARLGQEEAQLICYADLNPLGTYHWAKLDGDSAATDSQSTAPRTASQEDNSDDQALIEHYELINSDKHEIVMKQVNSETIQMVLTVRRIEKSDLTKYKCLARNSLGIQSNSIRLHEPTSFSLNSMFGGGGRTGGEPSDSTPASSDQQLNDQQDNTGSRHSSQQQQPQSSRSSQFLSTRANSRSPWIQRQSPASSKAASSSESSAALSSLLPSKQSKLLLVTLLALESILVVASSLAQVVFVFVDNRRWLPNNQMMIVVNR